MLVSFDESEPLTLCKYSLVNFSTVSWFKLCSNFIQNVCGTEKSTDRHRFCGDTSIFGRFFVPQAFRIKFEQSLKENVEELELQRHFSFQSSDLSQLANTRIPKVLVYLIIGTIGKQLSIDGPLVNSYSYKRACERPVDPPLDCFCLSKHVKIICYLSNKSGTKIKTNKVHPKFMIKFFVKQSGNCLLFIRIYVVPSRS